MFNHLTHLLGGILIYIHNISIQSNRRAYAITVISINRPFENESWISCLNQYGLLELWEYFSRDSSGGKINRGSYMSAHVLLNLLNELGKRDKMRGLPSILSLFRNEFNKFNNTRARMLDSI